MMNTTATNPPTWKKDVGIRATNDSALYYHIQRKGSSLPLECMNRSTEVIPPIRNTGILLTLLRRGFPTPSNQCLPGSRSSTSLVAKRFFMTECHIPESCW